VAGGILTVLRARATRWRPTAPRRPPSMWAWCCSLNTRFTFIRSRGSYWACHAWVRGEGLSLADRLCIAL